MTCGICQNEVYPVENAYICSEEGRLDKRGDHPTFHLKCMAPWAENEFKHHRPVRCCHAGCETDISHLLPPGFLRRASDYWSKRPAAIVLAVGAPLLAINAGAVAAVATVATVAAAEAEAAVAAVAVAAGAGAGAAAVGATGGAAGAAAVAAGAAAAAAAANAAGRGNFISTTAAVSGLIAASTLLNGGGLVLAVWFAAVSVAGACVARRFRF